MFYPVIIRAVVEESGESTVGKDFRRNLAIAGPPQRQEGILRIDLHFQIIGTYRSCHDCRDRSIGGNSQAVHFSCLQIYRDRGHPRISLACKGQVLYLIRDIKPYLSVRLFFPFDDRESAGAEDELVLKAVCYRHLQQCAQIVILVCHRIIGLCIKVGNGMLDRSPEIHGHLLGRCQTLKKKNKEQYC